MSESEPALLAVAARGLECAAGGFHVDPWEPVPLALVTHAHADRVTPGCARYVTSTSGVPLLRLVLGPEATIEALPLGESRAFGSARVSLHPSGRLLGGAQVRVERAGEVWVVARDWKRARDPSCPPFQLVRGDVFLTGASFALPIFTWPDPDLVAGDVLAWWESNRVAGRSSVVYARSPGVAEQLLGLISERTERPVHVHPSLEPVLAAYEAGGGFRPRVVFARAPRAREAAGELFVAPPEARGTSWARPLAKGESALASGSMQVRGNRRRASVDRGFVLSEHADWPTLLATVRETGASRVLVTHGRSHVLARALAERGVDARVLETPWRGEDASP